jgi:hypothetical protein
VIQPLPFSGKDGKMTPKREGTVLRRRPQFQTPQLQRSKTRFQMSRRVRPCAIQTPGFDLQASPLPRMCTILAVTGLYMFLLPGNEIKDTPSWKSTMS